MDRHERSGFTDVAEQTQMNIFKQLTFGKNLAGWIRERRVRIRQKNIRALLDTTPEFQNMTLEEVEEWIYGDVLK